MSIEARAAKRQRSPEAIAKLDKYRRDQYWDRKLRQVCVHCEAELGLDDGVSCAACAEIEATQKQIYRLKPRGRYVRREAQRSFIKKRYESGLCVICCTPRESWGAPSPLQLARAKKRPPQRCPECTAKYTAMQRRRNELKKQGVVPIGRRRRRQLANEKLKSLMLETSGYRPLDEVLASPRVRLLRAMRHFDWATTEQIFEAIGLQEYDDDDRVERDRFWQALSRLVSPGRLVERRRSTATRKEWTGLHHSEYRLTAAGREAARKYA